MNKLHDNKMINEDMANLAYGIVYQLLLSSIENIKNDDTPKK